MVYAYNAQKFNCGGGINFHKYIIIYLYIFAASFIRVGASICKVTYLSLIIGISIYRKMYRLIIFFLFIAKGFAIFQEYEVSVEFNF